jgi:predicted component of type VI protein secretion system
MAYAGTYIGYLDVVYSSGNDVEQGDRFTLAAENTIGCGSNSNIVIDGTGVMKKHARIFARDDDIWLQSVVPGNTQVNGRSVKDMQSLRTGDIVLVGDTAFMVHLKGVKKA